MIFRCLEINLILTRVPTRPLKKGHVGDAQKLFDHRQKVHQFHYEYIEPGNSNGGHFADCVQGEE